MANLHQYARGQALWLFPDSERVFAGPDLGLCPNEFRFDCGYVFHPDFDLFPAEGLVRSILECSLGQ